MSFKDARLNQKVLFMMILLLLLVVAVVALTLERNEGLGERGGAGLQETECKSYLAVVHYEGV